MTLNEFVAQQKRRCYDDVVRGVAPDDARCDEARLKDLHEKGRATMGATGLRPEKVVFEFIFSLESGESEVLVVEVDPPERIVCLPVPEWVVESIWQGEVQGSFHFESHAKELIERFIEVTKAPQDAKWFEPLKPKRRE